MGSYVIVINADKVNVSGRKNLQKYYFSHTQNKRSGSGRIGGYRIDYYKDLQKRFPERIITKAVIGMLPKDRLGRSIRVKHLKVFRGQTHPHSSQSPKDITGLLRNSPKEH